MDTLAKNAHVERSGRAGKPKEDRHFVTALARGLEVLSCFRSGDKALGNQEIAQRLHITPGTVANRLRTIFEKLGTTNRTEAALYALRMGWASLDDE